MQAQRFQGGLNPQIRSHIASFHIENFQELVNAASIAEFEQRNVVTAQINLERKMASPFTARGSSDKRRKVPRANKGKIVIPIPFVTCLKCGKAHGGECRFGLGMCFRC